MSLVVDSSIALAWCFEDEHTQSVMDLLDRVTETGAWAPSLWPLEVLNGLLMAERRNRVDRRRRRRLAGFLHRLPVTLDMETADQVWTLSVRLAEHHELTLHDAVYIELAQRRTLPLATLNADLIKAGKALGMTLLGT